MDPRMTARYGVSTPLVTHFRKATCAEVRCKHHINGWQMRVVESTSIGQRQVFLIKQSGRKFKTIAQPDHTLYIFEPGQTCFKEHRTKMDKPALYVVRQGEQVRRHTRPTHWVEDFSEHLDKIREQ